MNVGTDDPSFWLVIATSGLAGASFNKLIELSVQRYRRPRLHADFGPNVEGAVVDTQTNSNPPVPQRYLRLKILNTGRTAAENVEVSVTEIRFTAPGQVTGTFRAEVLDLPVAMSGQAPPFRIPAEGHRFVDLAFTTMVAGHAAYGFAFIRTPNTLVNFGFGVGQYSADILLSADNAAPRRGVAEWSWDGSVQGIRALGFTWRF